MENNIKQKNIKQQKVYDFSIKHSLNSQLFSKISKKSSRKEIEEYLHFNMFKFIMWIFAK